MKYTWTRIEKYFVWIFANVSWVKWPHSWSLSKFQVSIIEISQVQNYFWIFLGFVHFGFVRYIRKWQCCKLSMDWISTCLLEGIWLRISLVIWGPIILSIICHENELMGPKNRNSCLKITQNVAFELNFGLFNQFLSY